MNSFFMKCKRFPEFQGSTNEDVNFNINFTAGFALTLPYMKLTQPPPMVQKGGLSEQYGNDSGNYKKPYCSFIFNDSLCKFRRLAKGDNYHCKNKTNDFHYASDRMHHSYSSHYAYPRLINSDTGKAYDWEILYPIVPKCHFIGTEKTHWLLPEYSLHERSKYFDPGFECDWDMADEMDMKIDENMETIELF